MKTRLVTVLLLLFTAFAFGSSGYRGIKWYSNLKYQNLYFNSELQKLEEKFDFISYFDEYLKEGLIFDEKTAISFFSSDDEEISGFCAAGYITRHDNIDLLKSKFQGKPIVYKQKEFDFSDLFEGYVFESKMQEASVTLLWCAYGALRCEWNGMCDLDNTFDVETKDNEKVSGTLYIYNYNEDTRVYIYDNLVKNKIVVIYVPHEQDY